MKDGSVVPQSPGALGLPGAHVGQHHRGISVPLWADRVRQCSTETSVTVTSVQPVSSSRVANRDVPAPTSMTEASWPAELFDASAGVDRIPVPSS